ncbi:MAG: ATP-binding protein [Oscillospiraceae bacterium]|nr:ATP-binding protein [Oscillospiraceae bacterium]
MAYSSEINRKADEILRERRNSALRQQDMAKEKIFTQIPRLGEIERQLQVIGAQTAKAVLRGKDAVENAKSLSEKSLALQKESRELLINNGYSKDALEPHFTCPICKDTGKYDDEMGRTVRCECLKKLRAKIACEELNKVSPLSLCSFDNFSLNYYDMDVQEGYTASPYDRMSKILAYCKKYAENFSLNSPSLMMKGATGLGKTHLSLSIANEVINKGYGVVYVSAPMILSKLEKQHFSYAYDDEEDTLNTLVSCDLLIFDDLGTEFQSSYTSSTIYNIFNTRLLNGKPTIMSSNLTLKDMEKCYTPRFVSRVMGSCAKLDFIGKDIRVPRR